MDRPRRRSGLLILILAGGFAAPAAPPLRGLHWIAPGADAARILTERPVECLAMPKAADQAYLAEVGRAAFRTPLTLGGQAARAGIDCESCHRNGRRNADFVFPGLSGAPGTADVTSFVFSSHRGDHVDDPVPIPDLGGPKGGLKVSQAVGSPDLKRFIHGLVTQEFDGVEPPPAVLDGLVAYVRALSPTACPAAKQETLTVAADSDDARRAVRASLAALGRGDRATAVAMVGAARSSLGEIAERYAVLENDERLLRLADLDLAAATALLRRGDPAARVALGAWLARSNGWVRSLAADQGRSYYDRQTLMAGLAARDSAAAR
ncbi:MAG TPA: hypothetical protein VIC25_06575 [Caulobacteraceae bacterium]